MSAIATVYLLRRMLAAVGGLQMLHQALTAVP